METAEALAQRQALKNDKRVIKSINLFWKSFQKNARMEVEREQCVPGAGGVHGVCGAVGTNCVWAAAVPSTDACASPQCCPGTSNS